jgi:hypothetical protein
MQTKFSGRPNDLAITEDMAITEATFDITGRIGKITQNGKAVKISLGADAFRRSTNGEKAKITLWNTVTVFGKTAEIASHGAHSSDLRMKIGPRRRPDQSSSY